MSRTIPQKDTRTKVSFFAPTCRWMLLCSQLSTAGLSWPINLSNMRTCFLVRPIATVQPHDSAQCPCGGTAKNCDDNKYLERIAWMQQTQNGHNHLTPARRTETRTLHTRWQRNNPHSPTALALTNNTNTSWSTPTTPQDSRAHSFTQILNHGNTGGIAPTSLRSPSANKARTTQPTHILMIEALRLCRRIATSIISRTSDRVT